MGNDVQSGELDHNLLAKNQSHSGLELLPVATYHQNVQKSGTAQACSGFLASFTNVLMTFPINKAMLRQQLYGHFASTVIVEMRKEGLGYLYRGLAPIMLQKTVAGSVMFGSYGAIARHLEQHKPLPNVLSSRERRNLVAGGLSGGLEAFATPLERVQALLIDPKRHLQFKNSVDAFKFVRSYGVRELYRGYTCILLRNVLGSSLWFATRVPLKDSVSKQVSKRNNPSKSLELVLDFCTGSLIGATLSTMFYPISVGKMYMMSPINEPHISVWTALKESYRQRGSSFLRLYTGAHINFPRSLLSWGIINAVYEFSLTHLFPHR